MTGLDYEKQNRKEQPLQPADPGHFAAISKHVRLREAAKRHRARTYIRGVEDGVAQERARIVQWLTEVDQPNRMPCEHSNGYGAPCGNCNVFLEPGEVIEFVRNWGAK